MPLMPVSPLSSSYLTDRNSLAAAALGKGPREQIALLQAFAAKYPNDLYANQTTASTMIAAGQTMGAIPYAQRAVQFGRFEPDHVAQLIQLYLEFFYLEQIALLLPHIQSSGKTSARQDFALGRYYSRIGKPEQALPLLERAVATTTDRALRLSAQWQIMFCLRNANRNEEAKAVLRQLIEEPERHARALAELAQFVTGEEAAAVEQQLTALLAGDTSQLTAGDLEAVHLQLGNLKEKHGDHDAAFASWETSRRLVPPRYDALWEARFLKDQKAFYKRDLFEKLKRFGNPSDEMVFVVGMPRSGTTLMAQILSAHPDIASAGELVRLPQEAGAFLVNYYTPGGLKRLIADAEAGEIAARTDDFLKLARLVADRPAKRIIDKTPTQMLYAGYIHICFPKARFINMERHPADTFISTYQNEFPHEYSFAFDQKNFADYFLKRAEILAYWKTLFPELILDVSYEDLTRDPETTMKRVLAFLGMPWDPACLKFFERPTTIRTFSRDQVRSAITAKSVERWRRYEKHLSPLFDALNRAGYSYPQTTT